MREQVRQHDTIWMQSKAAIQYVWPLIVSRIPVVTGLCALLLWPPLAAVAANQLPALHLPSVDSIHAGEGVSWLLRSTSSNGEQPAVFLLAGPSGVSFRRVSEDQHQLNWSPTIEDAGRHQFVFLIEDATDRSITVTETLQIDVLPDGPAAEHVANVVLNAIPNQSVQAGEYLRFRVTAENSLGNETLLHIDALPAGARFVQNDDGSRTFLWHPREAHAGQYALRFVATDSDDSALFDDLTVNVNVMQAAAPTNVLENNSLSAAKGATKTKGVDITFPDITNPDIKVDAVIESLPERVIVSGQAMSQLVRAEFPGETLELVATRLPEGASFETAVGRERVFRWRPELNQVGTHQVRFRLRDRRDLKTVTHEDLHLTVRPDRVVGENKPPSLHVSGPDSVRVGEELSLSVAAVDPDGHTPDLMVSAAPLSARFFETGNGQRQFVWLPGSEDQGVHLLEFIARDQQAPEQEVLQRIRVEVKPAEALP